MYQPLTVDECNHCDMQTCTNKSQTNFENEKDFLTRGSLPHTVCFLLFHIQERKVMQIIQNEIALWQDPERAPGWFSLHSYTFLCVHSVFRGFHILFQLSLLPLSKISSLFLVLLIPVSFLLSISDLWFCQLKLICQFWGHPLSLARDHLRYYLTSPITTGVPCHCSYSVECPEILRAFMPLRIWVCKIDMLVILWQGGIQNKL